MSLALVTSLTPVAAQDTAPDFASERARWSEARLKATKLFKSMRVTISIEHPDAAAVADRLIVTDEYSLLQPTHPLSSLGYVTDGLGRHREIELLIEVTSGRVLQRTSLETGKRYKHRIYRFAADGALRRTRRPGPGEESDDPDGWSDRSEQWFPSPSAVAGEPLTEPGVVIYLIAASDLAHPGESFSLPAFSTSDESVYRLQAVVREPERVAYEYRLAGAGAGDDARRKGRVDALRVAIVGRPLAAGDDAELTILGMRDVELLLDPETRAPLQLRGRVAVFGEIAFKLRTLELPAS